MNTELFAPSQPQAALLQVDHEGLLSAFFGGRNALTVRAYERDLRAFQEFLGTGTLAQAAQLFFSLDEAQANAVLVSYKNMLLSGKLSASSVKRRLVALRSLIKLAKRVKLCRYDLEIETVTVEALRDTRGPGREGFLKLWAMLEGKTDPKSIRDRALLRMLYELGLRRNEAVSLDLEHINLEQGWVKVLGKAQRQRQMITIPDKTKEALKAWLKVRGEEAGPLFIALDRANWGRRLSGDGLHWICESLGKAAGIVVKPHGLRHAAITDALDATNGDIRAVRRFSRHKSLDMLLIYDDNRRDLGGEIAKMLSERT